MKSSRRIELLDSLLRSALSDEMPMGLYQSVPSAPMVEFAIQLGVSWVVINMEHSAIDSWTQVRELAQACDGAEVPFFVKIDHWSEISAHRALDLGAIGIIVPKVNTADELRSMSKAIKFPPFGDRGYCPVSKGNNWGREWVDGEFDAEVDAYWELARRVLIVPMIETVAAVDNLDSILAVDECPILFPGTADLGVAYSKDGKLDMGEKKRVDVIVSGKIKANKHKVCLHTHHPERAEAESVGRLNDLGIRMPALVDLWAFGGAVALGAKHIKAARTERPRKK